MESKSGGVENSEEEEEGPLAQAVDLKTAMAQKKQEIAYHLAQVTRLRRELDKLTNSCTMHRWREKWCVSHGIKTCTKCGKEEYYYTKGGRRKSRRRRKYKKRKTKRRRR